MGYPHPDYLLPLLSQNQFNEWIAYYSLEPFGYYENDLQNAVTRNVIAQSSGLKKKHGGKLSLSDFSLEDGREKGRKKSKGQSVDEMKQILLSIANRSKRKK